MKTRKLIPMICAICGILAGIGMICTAVLGEAFPRPLYAPITIGFFASAAGNLCNLRRQQNKGSTD